MRIFLIIILLLSFTSCSHSNDTTQQEVNSDKTSQARETTDSPLLYINRCNTTQGWDLTGAILDKEKQAIRLSNSAPNWRLCDRMISTQKVAIQPDHTYTISLKIKTEIWPPPSLEVSGTFYGDSGFVANSLGSIVANSQKGAWEESTVYVTIPKNSEIKYYTLRIIDLPKHGRDGNIWVKDVKLLEGFHTTKEKPSKKSFNGSVTKVDKLGNIEILKNGKFEPFFPIGIYTDHKRADWSLYKKQGFNIAMWTDGAGSIQKAKNAGLYASMQLIQYIIPVNNEWIPQNPTKKLAHLRKTLQDIKNRGLFNDLLFYYIDNEFYHLKKEYTQIADIVKEFDNNAHPLYMLNGTYAIARKYNKRVDFTGTYAAEDMYESDRTNALVTLNETQNQKIPTTMAQINRGVGKNFRPILFGAIAKGARGMGFWKDGGEAGDIRNQPWWRELPSIAQEIKEMMPLIRANQNSPFQVTSNQAKIIAGTRIVNNRGYIILANPTRLKKEFTLELENAPTKVKEARNFFDHKKVATIEKDRLTLTMQPQSSMVLELK